MEPLRAPSPPTAWQSPGVILLISLLIFASSAKSLLYDTLDPDLFWHLRVAQQLQEDGIGPLVDDISFASIKEPWTPYSWLAELGMAKIWQVGGYRLTLVVQAGMVAALLLLITLTCALRAGIQDRKAGYDATASPGSGLRVAAASAFAAFHCLPFLSFRPVMGALVALAFVVYLIVRDRFYERMTRALWLSVPLCLILANVHLFTFLIPVLFMATAVAAYMDRLGAPVIRRFVMLAGMTGLASLCTPMLPGIVTTIAHYQFQDVMVSGPFIAETQPFYSGVAGKIGLMLVLLATITIICRYKRLAAADWLWLAIAYVLLFKLARFSPIYAILSAPILCATLPRLSDRPLGRPVVVGAMAIILLVGLVRVVQLFPSGTVPVEAWVNRNGPDLPGYPADAARFVKMHVKPKTGRIVNEFSWGGYLAWELKDRFAILSDGRTQLYTSDFWKAAYFGSEAEQLRLLANTKADAAILPVRRSRYEVLLRKLGWDTIYSDSRAVVLTPPQPTAMLTQE